MLAGEVREFGSGADAVLAVAHRAGRGLLLPDFGIARCRGDGKGHCKKCCNHEDPGGHGGPHFCAAVATGGAPEYAASSFMFLSGTAGPSARIVGEKRSPRVFAL